MNDIMETMKNITACQDIILKALPTKIEMLSIKN